MSTSSGLVFDIRHFSVHDGPGLRVTVFLKGCPLSCAWCHNPESQSFETETYMRIHRLDDKEFEFVEHIGNRMSVNEVIQEVEKDISIFDESKGGVTFSGGEPLSQPEFLRDLLKACKAKEIHTAVDTSGFASQLVMESIIPLTDLFLFDIKHISEDEHKKYTGVSNSSIFKNLDLIAKSNKKVIIRIPLIQNITDTGENLKLLREVIRKYPSIERVDILPFHNIAKIKYERFGKNYTLGNAEKYDDQKAEQIKNYFNEVVSIVSIGG
ncbi:MAG: glycyl-radical enzyme activating protein [Bacteroidales bacterium]|nr:glycyl-radical enzyme activating protein [Bacteroidales bacterium]